MKKTLSLVLLSTALVATINADKAQDELNRLKTASVCEQIAHAPANPTSVLTVVPAATLAYLSDLPANGYFGSFGTKAEKSALAISLVLGDLFGQEAYSKVAHRKDVIARAIKTLTNRWFVYGTTAVALVGLNHFKKDSATIENATKIAAAQYAVAIVLQKLDKHLNAEAYTA